MKLDSFVHARRGNMLISDVIFLVLALAFVSILIAFIVRERSNVATLEEQSAKEIALLLDAAEPGMQVSVPLGALLEKKDAAFSGDAVVVDSTNHVVRVQLSTASGYSYSYFNGAAIHGAMRGDALEVSVG